MADNDSGQKFSSIKDNPFLKMDWNKAALMSKPVPKQVSKVSKPAFLRDQLK